jgi:Zn-dependent protease
VNFKVFGTQIYISFLFAAVITVMLCFDKTGMLLPTLFAVFMHECGHLFMMWILRCAPKEIRLIPASVQITSAFSGGYKNDVLIALSGPFVNFLLFGVCYFNFLRYENEFVGYFALVNLVISFFNLLPVKGLDGGTVLCSLLCKFCDINKATVMVRILSLFVATVVLITAVMLILKGNPNLSLFIMGVYLVVMSVMKM